MMQKVLKLAAVAVVFIGSWLLLLLQTRQAVVMGDIQQSVEPAIMLAIALPLATLAAIVFDQIWFALSVGVLMVVQLFLTPVSILAALSWLLLIVGFWWAYHRIQFELGNDVKFTATRLLRAGGGIIVLFYLAAVAVQAYGVVERSIAADELGFYRQVAGTVASGLIPLVERQLPGFKASITLDQYLASSFSPDEALLRARVSDEQQQELLAVSRRQLLEKLGIFATGQEPLADIAKEAITVKLRDLATPYRQYLPLLYTVGIFFLLRAAAFFVDIVAYAWGLPLFWLLRKIGFLKIVTTQIEAEHLTI